MPQKIMAGWLRQSGRLWVRHHQGFAARVTAGPGGWYWLVGDNDTGKVIAMGAGPTRRSRKARRLAQSVMLRAARDKARKLDGELEKMPARFTRAA